MNITVSLGTSFIRFGEAMDPGPSLRQARPGRESPSSPSLTRIIWTRRVAVTHDQRRVESPAGVKGAQEIWHIACIGWVRIGARPVARSAALAERRPLRQSMTPSDRSYVIVVGVDYSEVSRLALREAFQ